MDEEYVYLSHGDIIKTILKYTYITGVATEQKMLFTRKNYIVSVFINYAMVVRYVFLVEY